MQQSEGVQTVVLEVSLHREHFRHRITYWRTGGENDALVAGKFVKVAAFHKQVGRLLGFRGGQPRHVLHLGINEKVF